jgi:hypothetical protein
MFFPTYESHFKDSHLIMKKLYFLYNLLHLQYTLFSIAPVFLSIPETVTFLILLCLVSEYQHVCIILIVVLLLGSSEIESHQCSGNKFTQESAESFVKTFKLFLFNAFLLLFLEDSFSVLILLLLIIYGLLRNPSSVLKPFSSSKFALE